MAAPPPSRALLVMAKAPQAGATKTRLCPPLSPAQAAALYAALLDDTLALVRAAALADPTIRPMIAYTPAEAAPHFAELAPDFGLVAQVGPDLGARLDHVLTAVLTQGYRQAAAMSSDSPTLPVTELAAAFAALDAPGIDVVLGPSADGGYYLIGLKQPQPAILRGVQMSTPTVLAETVARAEEAGLRVAHLTPWPDIDTPDDLAALAAQLPLLPATTAAQTRALLSAWADAPAIDPVQP